MSRLRAKGAAIPFVNALENKKSSDITLRLNRSISQNEHGFDNLNYCFFGGEGVYSRGPLQTSFFRGFLTQPKGGIDLCAMTGITHYLPHPRLDAGQLPPPPILVE
jgi:hypothetical protein